MTEPNPRYSTWTNEPRLSLMSWLDARRQALLRELAELERQLGYGTESKPTTSHLRDLWQLWRGRCPHCGKMLDN